MRSDRQAATSTGIRETISAANAGSGHRGVYALFAAVCVALLLVKSEIAEATQNSPGSEILAQLTSGSTASAAPAQKITFNIKAQPLEDALNEFARQTGYQVLFQSGVADKQAAPAVEGTLTPEAALQVILSNSTLRYKFVNPRTVTISAPESGNLAKPISGSDSSAVLRVSQSETPNSSQPAQQSNAAGAQSVEDADKSTSQTLNAKTEKPDEIVVTGTYLRDSGPVGSPTIVITSRDIEHGGYTSAQQVIDDLPENFGGGQNPNVINAQGGPLGRSNAGSDFNATANLRGLGPESTLTLIDGHRISPSGSTGGGVDLSVIPLAAIERVEVLTDGAAAIYGSDAVGGVVNFRLRQHFQGVEAGASYGDSTQGGGVERQYNLTGGIDWQTGGALVSAQYHDVDPVLATERNFSDSPNSVYPSTLTAAVEQTSLFSHVHQDLTSALSVYVEGLYGHKDASSFSESVSGTRVNATPITVGDTQRDIIVGLNATLPGRWRAQLTASDGQDTESIVSPFITNGVTLSTSQGTYQNKSRYAELEADGPVVQLPAGPLEAALGGGYRYEYGGSSTERLSRNIRYAFSELRVPLVSNDPTRLGLEALTISGAVRYENYSDFGSTINPKFGFQYTPMDGVVVRASAGTSFRAPELSQLVGQSEAYLLPVPDPLSPTGVTTALIRDGANSSLQPERSHEWSAGFDLTPSLVRGLRISSTYYAIKYDGRIGDPLSTLNSLLTDPKYAPIVTRNPSAALLDHVIASVDVFDNFTGAPYDPASVGAYIAGGTQNIGRQYVRGADGLVSYLWEHVLGGNLTGSVNGSWSNFAQQLISGSPWSPVSGIVFAPPKYRARGGLTWENQHWSTSGFVNYVGSELDNSAVPYVRVSSWTTVDARLAFKVGSYSRTLEGMEFSVAVRNLFDRDPPFVRSSATLPVNGFGFDSANANPLGRYIRVGLTERW
jgi:iron complex outermembrane recepter protein